MSPTYKYEERVPPRILVNYASAGLVSMHIRLMLFVSLHGRGALLLHWHMYLGSCGRETLRIETH